MYRKIDLQTFLTTCIIRLFHMISLWSSHLISSVSSLTTLVRSYDTMYETICSLLLIKRHNHNKMRRARSHIHTHARACPSSLIVISVVYLKFFRALHKMCCALLLIAAPKWGECFFFFDAII